ncbi:NAD(P)-dependent oxidoreductase [Sphingobium lactosutens]|uniref:SDR family NAD(P)-dependent oxidoreductase n=1 Tax=Sphingobium lactosutens TaxID=522773 RepID=UPI0015BC0644|nr:SDR family oxidoreductase [Sphingobium lactosutens]NWK98749.1 NAD(P)-dependent oxidoreductase [Sphingobium lactosutens]
MSAGKRLEGKRVFILGAGAPGGIAAAIAGLFRAEGAIIALASPDVEQAAAVADDCQAVGVVKIDILDERSIHDGVRQAAELLGGGIDVAINAAGVNRNAPLAEETADALLFQARIHFIGTALFIKEVAESMPNGGSIMTMSSVTAELTTPRLAAYAGSKAAADKVVKVAAVEYGDRGIRVNSLAPGLTSTPMTAAYFADEKVVGAFQREIPIGRLSTVDDIAAAALWLASDDCIATGDTIRVSGGAHLRRLPVARDFV